MLAGGVTTGVVGAVTLAVAPLLLLLPLPAVTLLMTAVRRLLPASGPELLAEPDEDPDEELEEELFVELPALAVVLVAAGVVLAAGALPLLSAAAVVLPVAAVELLLEFESLVVPDLASEPELATALASLSDLGLSASTTGTFTCMLASTIGCCSKPCGAVPGVVTV